MPSDYGVQWMGEARAILAVVNVVAVDFAEKLTDEVDALADEPDRLRRPDSLLGGQAVAFSFWWYNYAVTTVVRLSERQQMLYVDRVTVESSVAGMNPFG